MNRNKSLDGDMVSGSPTRALIFFAFPLVLGNLLQQLYNVIDSIIVGNYVGEEALAAVGASSSITFLFVALATGMSIGSTVVIAQLFGAREYKKMKISITTIIITMFVISLCVTVAGVLLNNRILAAMNTPDNIMNQASDYLRIYFFGITFLFMYNIFTAVFNALGDSKKPLYFLAFSAILNVGLDLLFVLVFNMGVAGAAWATLISQALSAVLSGIVLYIKIKNMDINVEGEWFNTILLKKVFVVAIPSTIQQSIVSIGSLMVQRLVNGFGGVVMAGYAAAVKVDSIAIMPMIAVGSAMSTFTAQNIGANKPERIKKGYVTSLIMVATVAFAIAIILFVSGEEFVGMFVNKSTGQDVIEVGTEYLKVVSVFYFMMGFLNVTNGILRGAGDIKVYMFTTLLNFFLRVSLSYALVGVLGKSAIWSVIPIGWTVGFLFSWIRYLSGKWQTKKVI